MNDLNNIEVLKATSTRSYLKKADMHERAGRLVDALSLLNKERSFGENSGLDKIYEMNKNRVIMKIRRQARDFYATLQPKPIFECKNNPRLYADQNKDHNQSLPPLISFTTISSRIDRIEKTVSSLAKQTSKVHSINLYISSEPYLIDEGIRPDNPILKGIAAMGVNIYQVPNIGPYRKQIPLIIQLNSAAASPRTPFITIDDDVIYPSDIIERLITALETSEAVIAHRGREIRFDSGKLCAYKSFPPPSERSSFSNIGTGKNGIAYRLGYFPTNPLDFVGHIIAPTADDIWCKWAISAYCIPTMILEPAAAYDPAFDFAESEPLNKNGLFHKYNAKGTNDDAMQNMESFYASRGIGLAAMLVGVVND